MQTATNPQTGERVQWNGSAWVPLDAGAAPAPQPQAGPITIGTPRPKETFHMLSPEEAGQMGLPPGNYQMGANGKVEQVGGTNQKSQPSYDDLAKLNARGDSIKLLNKRINDLEGLYNSGFKGQGVGSAVEYAPGFIRPENANFDAAGNSLMGDIAAAQGLTAQQQNTPTELQIRFGPFIPQASDRDEVIVGKIARLRDIVQSQLTQVNAQRQALGLPPVNLDELAAQVPGGMAQADPQAAQQADGSVVHNDNLGLEQIAVTQNATKTVDNPELAGVRGQYLARIQRGDGPGEIVQFLRSAGITDPKLLQTAVQQANFRRKNPNVPIDKYNTDALDDMDVPLSGSESAMNALAQSAPGAYAMRAGNAVTANNLDSIVGMTGGNAERARVALNDASNMHPVAGLAGDLSGGVMAALASEAALARAGVGAGAGRALAADAGYGAAAGAGANDDNRLQGAVQGGLAGLAGSLGGQGVAKVAGSVVSPTGGRLADLYAEGVRPTVGQRMAAAGDGRGLAGTVGQAVSAFEEGLGSIPVVGAGIRGARQEARDQFQLGAYNQALRDIDLQLPKGMKPGTAPYKYTKKAFSNAYDKAREGMRIGADEELANDVGEIGSQAGALAEPSIRRFERIIKNVVLRRTGATIEGAEFKKMQSELGETIRNIRSSKTGDDELAGVLEQVQGALDRAARRHSDPQAVALLDKADAGYAKFVRIRAAAKSRGEGAAEFTPNQFDRAVQSSTPGRHSDAYLRGDALMQDYAQQGMALKDRLPNSGSIDRGLVSVAATGAAGTAGYIEPHTLGVLGVLGTLYAPGMRKVVSGAMAPRGPQARALADAIRKRGRIAGAAGTSLAVQGTSPGQ